MHRLLLLVALLLLPWPLSANAQGAQEAGFDDAADDLHLLLPLQPEGSGPAMVPSEIAPHADLRTIRVVHEDAYEWHLQVTTAGWTLDADAVPDAEWTVRVELELGATQRRFSIWAVVAGVQGPGAFTAVRFEDVSANHCNERSDCTSQPVAASFVPESHGLLFEVPKDSLMGLRPIEANTPRPPPALAGLPEGFEIRFTRVVSYARAPHVALSPVYDVAPSGPEKEWVALRYAAANHDLRLHGAHGSRLHVVEDVEVPVEFRLENAHASKRLVRLNYSWSDGAAEGFVVQGPTSLSVPGQTNRSATLWLRLPPTLPPSLPRLVIDARSVDGAVARTAFPLAQGLQFGAEGPALVAHLQEPRPQPLCAPFLPCSDGLLKAAPAAEGWIFGRQAPGGDPDAEAFTLPIEPRLALDHAWVAGGSLQGVLVFDAPLALPQVTVQLLLTSGTQTLLEHTATTSFERGENRWPINVPAPGRTPSEISSQSSLSFTVVLSPDDDATRAALDAAPPFLRAGDSQVRLPLEARRRPAPTVEPPFLLRAIGESEDFVNPGETRRFNVSVLNPHADERPLRVGVTTNATGWTAEVRPGSEFWIGAGELLTLGVEVRAPLEGVEGEVATVEISASDGSMSPAVLRLRLTWTAGVDLADDAGRYGTDEEAAARLVTPAPASTPWPAALAFVALLVALRARGRRRAR